VLVRFLLVVGMAVFMMPMSSGLVLVVVAMMCGVVVMGVFVLVRVGMLVQMGMVVAVRHLPVRVGVLVVVPVLVVVLVFMFEFPFHVNSPPFVIGMSEYLSTTVGHCNAGCGRLRTFSLTKNSRSRILH
jgi:hypothetical protein